ncbi:cell division protein ZapE [Demequina sp.]|uniref:cell division protein ZapE n=1 Tax=Demequina sp. TaxID=2050685 RepID=UPI003D0ED1D0
MHTRLVGRRPTPQPAELIASLTPPPHFEHATFASYVPDSSYPSQATALGAARDFARGASGRKKASGGKGLYLDGGFGVGKTHLLTAMAHEVGAGAAFGTFLEYTSLVGALGFAPAREALSAFRLVCIDEFELDDPGDTLLMARLMRELADAGVAIAATSNTPPGALGEGRFAAEDFRREIQALSSRFSVVTIDGPDYRHRDALGDVSPSPHAEVAAVANQPAGVVEAWGELIADLAHVHPSRYAAYIDGVETLGLRDVAALGDQNQALRLVMLVDRLYDANVRVVASGAPWSEVFAHDMLEGGYRKKYLRALSRLHAMTAGTD